MENTSPKRLKLRLKLKPRGSNAPHNWVLETGPFFYQKSEFPKPETVGLRLNAFIRKQDL